jgi:hypothetical protein
VDIDEDFDSRANPWAEHQTMPAQWAEIERWIALADAELMKAAPSEIVMKQLRLTRTRRPKRCLGSISNNPEM